jgi:hypothetical protein
MSEASGRNAGFHVLPEFVCTAIPVNSLADVSNGDAINGCTVTVFHDVTPGDSHRAFQDWRKANLDGFFLNCRATSSALLHRAGCRHHGDMEWDAAPEGSLTKHAKICATHADALRQWASDHGFVLSECSDCQP